MFLYWKPIFCFLSMLMFIFSHYYMWLNILKIVWDLFILLFNYISKSFLWIFSLCCHHAKIRRNKNHVFFHDCSQSIFFSFYFIKITPNWFGKRNVIFEITKALSLCESHNALSTTVAHKRRMAQLWIWFKINIQMLFDWISKFLTRYCIFLFSRWLFFRKFDISNSSSSNEFLLYDPFWELIKSDYKKYMIKKGLRIFSLKCK